MRLTAVLLILTTFTPVDDDRKPTGDDSAVVTPEKQMEKAFAEYRKLLIEEHTPTDWPDDIQTQRAKKAATEQKRLEIIKMHKTLGMVRDQDVYEKAKANGVRVYRELEKLSKENAKRNEANHSILRNNNATAEDLKRLIPKTPNNRHLLTIELKESLLLESLNTLFPFKDNEKGPAIVAGPSNSSST